MKLPGTATGFERLRFAPFIVPLAIVVKPLDGLVLETSILYWPSEDSGSSPQPAVGLMAKPVTSTAWGSATVMYACGLVMFALQTVRRALVDRRRRARSPGW